MRGIILTLSRLVAETRVLKLRIFLVFAHTSHSTLKKPFAGRLPILIYIFFLRTFYQIRLGSTLSLLRYNEWNFYDANTAPQPKFLYWSSNWHWENNEAHRSNRLSTYIMRTVLVKPEPCFHPVTTTTWSPVLIKPRMRPNFSPLCTRLSTSFSQSLATPSVGGKYCKVLKNGWPY